MAAGGEYRLFAATSVCASDVPRGEEVRASEEYIAFHGTSG